MTTAKRQGEQLSDFGVCEKDRSPEVKAHSDLLSKSGLTMSGDEQASSSIPTAGGDPHRHRRKRNRPVQYRPTDSFDVQPSIATGGFTHGLSTPPSNFQHHCITLPSEITSTIRQAKKPGSGVNDQGCEGTVPSVDDPDPAKPVNLMGIMDIHKTIARQLEQASSFANSEHQPCPFCSYVFSSVAFLARHLKYRHGINLEMQVDLPPDTTEPSGQTPYQPTPNADQDPSLNLVSASASLNCSNRGQRNTEELLQPSLMNGDGNIESWSNLSIHTPEVSKSEVKGQRSEISNKLLDRLGPPMFRQVAVDSQPGQPIIVCDKCTRAFTTKEDLEQHQQVHNVAKAYQCQHCHKLFQNPSSLKKHTRLHTDGKIYACEYCDKSFAAAAYLKTHLRLHTKQKPFVCRHCGKAFAASGTLISHERIHINDKPYGCEFCGKRFRQGSHLNRHKIIHTNLKPHVCSKCSRAFADVANLRRHERIHNQDNPNVCAECGKSFINLSSLKKHERLHTNEKPYVCRHCSKPFASSGNLISHERTHTNERPYVCKECGKAFTQSSHLKAHMGTHSMDTLYVCKHCGRGFTQRSTLCVHERIHLNKKPYTCKICDRAFTQSSTLKAHIRTHTKEKAHICKVCGKAFSARGNLRTHELIHTDEKPFKCEMCTKAFKQGSTLRAHERTHTNERPYVCRACGKTFADGSNLKAHILRIHSGGNSPGLGLVPGGLLGTNR
ncbi:zinc finger protein 345-like [Acanthaster planci]|uniref:Zinc finger protein 345-like n=1 Tax=Acanthaster planci TaxID=133434 RepID=A0A8B7ZUJ9_ACAPL|nr:zinc finger protein 345-like [Acanthaster planci]